ncbi:WbqC family protein [Marinobacter sp. S6332]|uniref:WbqC family protein n=1 Tax=Marinobacter sp. S6332 TaxID=2926403 RepID=UPI001FF32F14|nr:WbqC family protein [Marinobacter sp. S6332]MCK0163754.1 WbqC family protein [Marinobacter sp. S6332]
MKLAVMQPYLFPYIGYFHLIYASDLFVIYDDVSYIKSGNINRNKVLSPSGVVRFTVPVLGASQNRLICDLSFSKDVSKVLKMIEYSYSDAPYFEFVYPVILKVLKHEERSIASVCLHGFEAIFSYLGIDKKFRKASGLEYDRTASAQDKLVSLCHKFDAEFYVNAPGGRQLYTKVGFAVHGVKLMFVDSLPVRYQQRTTEFVPNLSIIDVLMNCSPREVVRLLSQYEFN